MKQEDFKLWVSRVGALTDAQVQELYERLRLLGKSQSSREHTEIDEDDWLWPGITAALKNKGWLSSSSVFALKSSKHYKRYQRDAPAVRSRLIRLVREGDTRSRDTLAYITGQALILWCAKKRLPESPGTVINMVCHAKEALELQFPGYIDAKLFQLVLGNLDERLRK